LEKVLSEQKLSMSGVTDAETAVKVGKLVGAKFVMVGSISKLGNTYTLNSRLIDVESGRKR
jgi:TolB-like protein